MIIVFCWPVVHGGFEREIGAAERRCSRYDSASQITDRADTLKSDATRNLLLTSVGTLIVLLVLLILAALARPPRRHHRA